MRTTPPVVPATASRRCGHNDEWTNAFFAEQDRMGAAARFDRSKAPVIMELLRKQLLSPRWVQHSARVLFLVGQAPAAERAPILEAIFDLPRGGREARAVGEVPEERARGA